MIYYKVVLPAADFTFSPIPLEDFLNNKRIVTLNFSKIKNNLLPACFLILVPITLDKIKVRIGFSRFVFYMLKTNKGHSAIRNECLHIILSTMNYEYGL